MPIKHVTARFLLTTLLWSSTSLCFGFSLPLPPSDTTKKITPENAPWTSITVHRGDSFISLLEKNHLPTSEWSRLDDSARHTLDHIQPGHELSWKTHNGQISHLRYVINQTTTLYVDSSDGALSSTISTKQLTPKNDTYHLVIKHSLSQALHRSHLPASLLIDLKHMFSHEVNMHHLHTGDTLDLLISNRYLDNQLATHGPIIAAILKHNHTTLKAFFYTLPNQTTGVYDEDGDSLLLSLDHWPCHFKRISSGFSYHRMDPILHRYASHLGLDLAAHTGTPVHSIGNGTVILSRWDGGYGKAIKVRYSRHFVALYAHLSRYAKGIHPGKRVRRGEVIGYVGQTGWATGPHLHFGFYVDRTAVDWRHFKRPVNPSIPKRDMPNYRLFVKDTLEEMDLPERTERISE